MIETARLSIRSHAADLDACKSLDDIVKVTLRDSSCFEIFPARGDEHCNRDSVQLVSIVEADTCAEGTRRWRCMQASSLPRLNDA
jgi:hypothetical protein